MFVFEPTNAKPPTPVTQFGNCQILPLAFMFRVAIFADPWGPRQSQGRRNGGNGRLAYFRKFGCWKIAQDTFGGITTGITATLHLSCSENAKKPPQLHITRISGQVVLRNMIGNHGMSCHKFWCFKPFHSHQTAHCSSLCKCNHVRIPTPQIPSPIFWGLYPSASGARFRRSAKSSLFPPSSYTSSALLVLPSSIYLTPKPMDHSSGSIPFRLDTPLHPSILPARTCRVYSFIKIKSEPFNLSIDPISNYQDVLIEGIGVFRHNLPGKSQSTRFLLYQGLTCLLQAIWTQIDTISAVLSLFNPSIRFYPLLAFNQMRTFLAMDEIQNGLQCGVAIECLNVLGTGLTPMHVRTRIDLVTTVLGCTEFPILVFITSNPSTFQLQVLNMWVVLERSGALDAGLTERRPTVPPTCQPIALNDSLPYCQPFNTFLSTVRIQSDADFPWNGLTFGRVRRRIDAHAPSSSPTIAFNDSATPQYICDERLSTFGCELTWQQPRLLQLVRINLCLNLKHARNRIDLITAESQLSQVFDIPVSERLRTRTDLVMALLQFSVLCCDRSEALIRRVSRAPDSSGYHHFGTRPQSLRVYDEIGMMPLLGRTRIDLITAESQLSLIFNVLVSDYDSALNSISIDSTTAYGFNRMRTSLGMDECPSRLDALGTGLTPMHVRMRIDLVTTETHLCLTFKHARNRIDLITAESQLSQVSTFQSQLRFRTQYAVGLLRLGALDSGSMHPNSSLQLIEMLI
ncbi:hypothetical protein B0H10DRAFT_2300382 [Mycena sp. CBHHK59/15]|nr:hypothetical protein B0H10DRAFT_2300382 [Mycena sp. CBHHK59/15]